MDEMTSKTDVKEKHPFQKINATVRVNKVLFLMSLGMLAFCFSWLSPLITALITGGNLIEIFLVIGLVLLQQSRHPSVEIMYSILKSVKFQITFLFLLCFAVLGILNTNGEFAFVYADLRSNLMFIFFILLFTSRRWNSWKPSFRIEIITGIYAIITAMDILSIILRPYLNTDWTISKQPLLILAPSFLAVFYLRKGNFLLSFLFTIAMLYEAVVGFYRYYYLTCAVIGLILIVTVFQNVLTNKIKIGKKIKSVSLIAVVITLVIFSSSIVYNYWTSNESRMIHSINRTQDFVNDSGSEKERIGSINAILLSPERFFVPQGIGWRGFIKIIEKDFKDYNIISSMDSCFFYLAYHYGIFIFIIVIGAAGRTIFLSLANKSNRGLYFSRPIRITFLILFIVSFSTHGIMLTTPQGAFVFASFFALILKPL